MTTKILTNGIILIPKVIQLVMHHRGLDVANTKKVQRWYNGPIFYGKLNNLGL